MFNWRYLVEKKKKQSKTAFVEFSAFNIDK